MSNLPVQYFFQVRSLSAEQHAQLCCTYAALILHDDNQEVNAQQMQKLITASGTFQYQGNKIEKFWAGLFAQMLQKNNVNDLLTSGGSSSQQQDAPQQGAPQQSRQETKQEVKKEEKPAETEEDMDMGGLFD